MDDEALLLRAQRGDREALRGFCLAHWQEGFRLALLIAGSRELAEEALQETWVGLMEGLHRFDPARGSARGWFLGILRRQVAAQRRARRRRPTSLELPDLLLSQELSPEGSTERREARASLLKAMESLPPEDREVLAGYWLLGWDARTLGEILGVSPEAARQRAHRSLLALKALLGSGDKS